MVRLEILLQAIDQVSAPMERARQKVQAIAAPMVAAAGATARLARASGLGLLVTTLGAIASGARQAAGELLRLGARAARISMRGALLGGAAGYGFVRQFIQPASDMEQLRLRMEGVTGSAGAAQRAMGWVGDFAMRTGFDIGQLAQGFISLHQSGLRPTDRLMRIVGNAAAVMGVEFSEASEAVASATRGELGALRQFGIEARNENNQVILEWESRGRRMRAVMGQNDRSAIARYTTRALGELFPDGIERRAQTWAGMMSMLRNYWLLFTQEVMKAGVFDWLRGQLQGLLERLRAVAADGSLRRWAEETAAWLMNAFRAMRDFIVGTDEAPGALTRLSNALAPVASALGWIERNFGLVKAAMALVAVFVVATVAPAIALMAKGLIALGVVLLGTPVGWVILAAALIAGAAYLIYENWETIAPFFQRLWDTIRELFSGIGAWAIPFVGPLVAAVQLIRENWEPLVAFFQGIGNGIAAAIEAAWARIRPIAEAISAAANWVSGGNSQQTSGRVGAMQLRQREFRDRIVGGGTPGAAAAVPGGAPQVQLNGSVQLDVRVQDDRVNVSGRSSDPRLDLSIGRGPAVVLP